MIILLCLMCLPMYLCFNVFMLSYRVYRIHNKDYMRTIYVCTYYVIEHNTKQHMWQCICFSPLILFYPCFYCCIVIIVFTYDTRAHVLCVLLWFFVFWCVLFLFCISLICVLLLLLLMVYLVVHSYTPIIYM